MLLTQLQFNNPKVIYSPKLKFTFAIASFEEATCSARGCARDSQVACSGLKMPYAFHGIWFAIYLFVSCIFPLQTMLTTQVDLLIHGSSPFAPPPPWLLSNLPIPSLLFGDYTIVEELWCKRGQHRVCISSRYANLYRFLLSTMKNT